MNEIDRDSILRILPRLDGHSIFSPSLFLNAGMPLEFVTTLSMIRRPDLPTATLHRATGQGEEGIQGIHGLEALHAIAEAIGVDRRVVTALDPETAADQLKAAIRQRCRATCRVTTLA